MAEWPYRAIPCLASAPSMSLSEPHRNHSPAVSVPLPYPNRTATITSPRRELFWKRLSYCYGYAAYPQLRVRQKDLPQTILKVKRSIEFGARANSARYNDCSGRTIQEGEFLIVAVNIRSKWWCGVWSPGTELVVTDSQIVQIEVLCNPRTLDPFIELRHWPTNSPDLTTRLFFGMRYPSEFQEKNCASQKSWEHSAKFHKKPGLIWKVQNEKYNPRHSMCHILNVQEHSPLKWTFMNVCRSFLIVPGRSQNIHGRSWSFIVNAHCSGAIIQNSKI